MLAAALDQYESFPDPSPAELPIGPAQLDRIDDGLHLGWAWHRYRYAYRRWDKLRILDAGCGTGLSTLGLARLNPGSNVLGLDASPRALGLASERLTASGQADVDFLQHDLDDPLPTDRGPFDFVACRRVLGQAGDPARLLENLVRTLDARGLLLATLPARAGRQPARQLRRAVEALAPTGADLGERARIGRELFEALRPDHPIRLFEARFSGPNLPGVDRIVAGYLRTGEREWELAEAIDLVEQAGLRFLYVASGHPWRPDRIFGPAVPDSLKARVEGLGDREQALLIDALDPAIHGDEFRIYACHKEFEPRLPGWPDERREDPAAFDRLIPHPSGLAAPASLSPDPAAVRGRVSYRVVNGFVGEIDHRSHLLAQAADGRRTCGEIDRDLHALTRAVETPETRQARWLDLANFGFVLLESPDRRQHVDCVHLGPIRDRLDCPCPRRWVRECERHDFCTIDVVKPDDPHAPALSGALSRLGIGRVIACAECPDYVPDE